MPHPLLAHTVILLKICALEEIIITIEEQNSKRIACMMIQFFLSTSIACLVSVNFLLYCSLHLLSSYDISYED